jgi:hypothetical protein
MKKLISTFLFLSLASCYQLERNCTDFKTGNFSSTTEVEGKTFTTTFSRNDSIQIETFNNVVDTFSIRWVNDCEYVLENVKPKNRQERKAVLVRILNTKDLMYNYEYSFVGETKKQLGSVTKQK